MIWFYEMNLSFPRCGFCFFSTGRLKPPIPNHPAPRAGCSRILRVFIVLIAIALLSTTRIPLPWLYLQLWPVGFWPFWLGAAVTIPVFCSPSGRASTSAETGAAPSPLSRTTN